MSTPSIANISQMLQHPETVTDAELDNIQSLLKAYPYFVPGHYIDAARVQKMEYFGNDMLESLQLYKGNWQLLHNYLEQAANKPAPQVIVEELKPEIAAETIEDNAEVAIEETPAEVTATVAQQAEPEVEPITEAPKQEIAPEASMKKEEQKQDPLIQPVYTEDYFRHAGVTISNELPEVNDLKNEQGDGQEPKSLMVVMSFTEWLKHFKTTSQKAQEEEADKKALKSMWQQEKLAAAFDDEAEEIPEDVFEMAVNSIAHEDGLASESLAEIHIKQVKYDKAIEMYRKLSLRNPQKNTYFARKIEEVLKLKQS